MFDQVDILKKEVSQLQESLQNSYVKIKEPENSKSITMKNVMGYNWSLSFNANIYIF